jgi:hypothetical protein
LVVCAFRDVAKNITAPTNTVVLDREMLKALYTPSLSSRPQFMLPGDVKKQEDKKKVGETSRQKQRQKTKVAKSEKTETSKRKQSDLRLINTDKEMRNQHRKKSSKVKS